MERTVLRDVDGASRERYDYGQGRWVRDVDSWWRHCMNSNDYEGLTKREARGVIERNGGDFDGGRE